MTPAQAKHLKDLIADAVSAGHDYSTAKVDGDTETSNVTGCEAALAVRRVDEYIDLLIDAGAPSSPHRRPL